MSASQRRKGKVGERAAKTLLGALYGDARRGLSQARGAEVPDVDGCPWWVEVKRGRTSPSAAMDQAERDRAAAGDARPPLALTKRDRKDWLVTMRFEDFAALVLAERVGGMTMDGACQAATASMMEE